ncbi:hypothetical protein GGX14DRAFT_592576 [Mycena pura]|uniref:Uncharacterized protein n=1 Tax=Mycena pura TaxID=153505 RepID=A0AAD6YG45_9AGAR|nr:hypothetical protein GGX14DRAFT_592576 [Mycena pura]
MDEMGETGTGIETEEDLIPGMPLTTKWGEPELDPGCALKADLGPVDEIKKESPWFWNMRSLIGERPNLRPSGIGNTSTMDTTVLNFDLSSSSPPWESFDPALGLDNSDEDGNQDGRAVSSCGGKENAISLIDSASEAGDLDAKQRKLPGGKRSRSPSPFATSHPHKKKTGPRPSISDPAPAKSSKGKDSKPATAKDKFNVAVLAEETTVQEGLKLRRERETARKEIALAKIKSESEAKAQKRRAKEREREMKWPEDGARA